MTNEVKTLASIGVITILIIVGAVFFLGRGSQTTPSDEVLVDQKFLQRDDSYSIGSPSAKVKLVEFGDYQCPACASAEPIMKVMIATYKDQLQFVFRNFPLTQHKNAKLAALVAEAAGQQGKFWEMHDALYENQTEWAESNTPIKFFLEYAKRLKLNVEKLQKDITQDTLDKKIAQDLKDGGMVGINSTPTFFINGKMLKGIPQASELQKMIDEQLKR